MQYSPDVSMEFIQKIQQFGCSLLCSMRSGDSCPNSAQVDRFLVMTHPLVIYSITRQILCTCNIAQVSMEFIQKIQQLDVHCCFHAIGGDSCPNIAQVPIDSWSMTHPHIDSASTCRHEHHEQIWLLSHVVGIPGNVVVYRFRHIGGIQRLYDRVSD
jgi:hypothetical protein